MLIALPILTLVAMLSGLFGGALVCALAWIYRRPCSSSMLHRTSSPTFFHIAFAKAPIFALLNLRLSAALRVSRSA